MSGLEFGAMIIDKPFESRVSSFAHQAILRRVRCNRATEKIHARTDYDRRGATPCAGGGKTGLS
jgi:hypothetical protein